MSNEIKPEQVPREVALKINATLKAHGLGFASAGVSRKIAAAALSAWPGGGEGTCDRGRPHLILPLPTQENGDD